MHVIDSSDDSSQGRIKVRPFDDAAREPETKPAGVVAVFVTAQLKQHVVLDEDRDTGQRRLAGSGGGYASWRLGEHGCGTHEYKDRKHDGGGSLHAGTPCASVTRPSSTGGGVG